MANLTNGTVDPADIDPQAGTATVKVTTDEAVGTLYAAVRATPYAATDQEVVKGDPGNLWEGNIVDPGIGEHSFSVTGLPSSGTVYAGFAQEGAAAEQMYSKRFVDSASITDSPSMQTSAAS